MFNYGLYIFKNTEITIGLIRLFKYVKDIKLCKKLIILCNDEYYSNIIKYYVMTNKNIIIKDLNEINNITEFKNIIQILDKNEEYCNEEINNKYTHSFDFNIYGKLIY